MGACGVYPGGLPHVVSMVIMWCWWLSDSLFRQVPSACEALLPKLMIGYCTCSVMCGCFVASQLAV